MSEHDFPRKVAEAYLLLPEGEVRPVEIADAIIAQLAPGQDPAEYSELRDILVGMSSMWLSLVSDKSLRNLLKRDPLDRETIH